MKLNFISVFAVTVFLLLLIISGCSDTPTTPGNQLRPVNGKVVNMEGLPINGVTVSIQNKNTITGSDGSFVIDDISEPYDVKLLKVESPSAFGTQFIGLRNFSPVLTGNTGLPVGLTATINLTLPFTLTAMQEAVVIFSDDQEVFTSNKILGGQGATVMTIMWSGAATVNGKLYVLVYTKIGNTITTYDNYGAIDYTVNAGSVQTKNISNAEIATNPFESSVTGVVNSPSGYTQTNSRLVIKFGGGIFNFVMLSNVTATADFGYVVPVGLASAIKLGIFATAAGPLGESTWGTFEVQPGGSFLQLPLNAAPNLNTPANNTSAVDTNTIFTYTQGEGSGVYVVQFGGGSNSFAVFTESTTSRIPNFLPFGVALGNNVNYSWSVAKFNTSIDNLVSAGLNTNPHVTKAGYSQSWFFTSN